MHRCQKGMVFRGRGNRLPVLDHTDVNVYPRVGLGKDSQTHHLLVAETAWTVAGMASDHFVIGNLLEADACWCAAIANLFFVTKKMKLHGPDDMYSARNRKPMLLNLDVVYNVMARAAPRRFSVRGYGLHPGIIWWALDNWVPANAHGQKDHSRNVKRGWLPDVFITKAPVFWMTTPTRGLSPPLAQSVALFCRSFTSTSMRMQYKVQLMTSNLT